VDRIEVMSDTQLGAERDLFEGLTLGTVDAAIVTNMVVAASIDIANVFELPFVYNTEDQVYGLMQDESFTKPLRDTLYNDWSIYCPVLIEGGFRKTVTNREFRDIPSLTGQKLRAPESRIFLETFSAIGANPTSMSLPEAVTGLQQGVVDGMEIVIPSINSIGLYEMADYVVATDHIYTCAEICFSRSFWDNLPAEEQAWFNDACVKAAADEVKFVREMNELNIQKFKDSGCTYIPASEVDRASMRQAVQPLLDDYRDIIGAELFDKAMAAVA
jgi:TRAP-type C4-dicarboxylate transport system substrate-binding protein